MADDDILRRAGEAYLAGDDALCETLAREAGETAQALRLRGLVRLRAGDPAAAAALLVDAANHPGRDAVVLNDLGVAMRLAGQTPTAARAFTDSTILDPAYAPAWRNLGMTLRALGDLTGARAALEKAAELAPADGAIWRALGIVRREAGDLEGARAAFEEAEKRAADPATACVELGFTLRDMGRTADAEAAFRRAVTLDPESAEAHRGLGAAILDLGGVEEARRAFEACLARDPASAGAAHALMMLCVLSPEFDGNALRARAENWARAASFPDPAVHSRRARPDRLRVGWVSPDFRLHSCAFFLEAPFAHRDRARFEAFAYAQFDKVRGPDAVSAHLRGLADSWVEIGGWSGEALAKRMREDRIDVLIELAGFSRDSRLDVTLRKPAPLIASWLGFPCTTGVAQVDLRVGDAIVDPPANDSHWTERMVRLDGPFIAYAPPAHAPLPAARPAAIDGAVTFGSFNNSAKLNPPTFALWARILAALPRATLLLKDDWTRRPLARARIETMLADAGIARARCRLVDHRFGMLDHLGTYGQIDIALDPLPYNGTTTTCEALWMGVPVVTLVGDRHAARVGASLLTHAGLADFVANTGDDYVRIAVELARAPERLRFLRDGLRGAFAASPVCDLPGFARRFESALDDAWDRLGRG